MTLKNKSCAAARSQPTAAKPKSKKPPPSWSVTVNASNLSTAISTYFATIGGRTPDASVLAAYATVLGPLSDDQIKVIVSYIRNLHETQGGQ